VQGLLRMATQQQDDTDHSRTQQQNVRRPQLTDFQQNGRSSVLPTPQTMPKSPLPSGGNITADDKEKTRRAEEIKRKQTEVDSSREQEDRMLHESSKRRVGGKAKYASVKIFAYNLHLNLSLLVN